ncbi:hypothetical protein ABW19_dt0208788 [Dactylella cylindrospora]|nr:hypothetical protein ABW19_dt0208788 [Dactylella cylindrospora]
MPFVRFTTPASPFAFAAPSDPLVDFLSAIASEAPSHCAPKSSPKAAAAHCAPRRRIVKRYITPNFDVSEREHEYALEGELPGVSDKSSITIDFEDAQTIVIKGEIRRTAHQAREQEGEQLTEEALQASAAAEEQKAEKATVTTTDGDTVVYDDAASTTSSAKRNPHHVTVEDEVDESETASNASFEVVDGPVLTRADKGKTPVRGEDVEMTEAAAKPAEPLSSIAATPTTAYGEKKQNEKKRPAARYWISERPIGVFERKFKFQGLIDQDNVKATLENGLLTIVVPKREAYVRQVFIY